MALLSELVATCAEHRLDSEATLGVFARRLREARRLSQAGRGRGAAHMSYLDAARFLIACAATDHPERAVDAEYVFSNLVQHLDMVRDPDFPLPIETAPTLDVALSLMLQAVGNGQVDQVASTRWREKHPHSIAPPLALIWLRINRGHANAELRLLEGRYIFQHPALKALTDSMASGTFDEVRTVATEALTRETHRFQTGKNLTAELDGTLLRAVASLISGSGSA